MPMTQLQEFLIKWDAWTVDVAAKRAGMRISISRATPEELEKFAEAFDRYAAQVAGMRERLPAVIAQLKTDVET